MRRRSAAAGTLLLLCAACARLPATARDGQWIWSSDDAARFTEARAQRPRLLAGVLVATITYDSRLRHAVLGLSFPPSLAGSDSIAAVVRLERSLDQAWATTSDDAIARDLGERFDTLMAVLSRQPVAVTEVQLDYDAPVRRLSRWARVAGRMTRGPLRGHEVWVTSIVSHLRDRAYGRLFRGEVAGHILQLFDTGERADSAAADEVAGLLAHTDLPFRIGLGAFERQHRDGSTTDHRSWFAIVPRLRVLPMWHGLWIFPAGQRWDHLVEGGR